MVTLLGINIFLLRLKLLTHKLFVDILVSDQTRKEHTKSNCSFAIYYVCSEKY